MCSLAELMALNSTTDRRVKTLRTERADRALPRVSDAMLNDLDRAGGLASSALMPRGAFSSPAAESAMQ